MVLGIAGRDGELSDCLLQCSAASLPGQRSTTARQATLRYPNPNLCFHHSLCHLFWYLWVARYRPLWLLDSLFFAALLPGGSLGSVAEAVEQFIEMQTSFEMLNEASNNLLCKLVKWMAEFDKETQNQQ